MRSSSLTTRRSSCSISVGREKVMVSVFLGLVDLASLFACCSSTLSYYYRGLVCPTFQYQGAEAPRAPHD